MAHTKTDPVRVPGLLTRLGSHARSMAFALVLLVMVRSVDAQDQLRVPQPPDDVSSPKYLMIALALVLTGGIVAVMVLKPKRGHQD